MQVRRFWCGERTFQLSFESSSLCRVKLLVSQWSNKTYQKSSSLYLESEVRHFKHVEGRNKASMHKTLKVVMSVAM